MKPLFFIVIFSFYSLFSKAQFEKIKKIESLTIVDSVIKLPEIKIGCFYPIEKKYVNGILYRKPDINTLNNSLTNLFIDGIKISDPKHLVPFNAINQIKIYDGSIPAMYGDVLGSVISIETKTYFDFLWNY